MKAENKDKEEIKMQSLPMFYLDQNNDKSEWKAGCSDLWQRVFLDRPEFVELYMQSTWLHNQVLLLSSDHKKHTVVSMLHMNPYTVQIQDESYLLHYIVGVCTEEKDRGKGYMRELLLEALHRLRAQGEPFTYLMPAATAIYTPYDFVPVAQADQMTVPLPMRKEEECLTAWETAKKIRVQSLSELSETQMTVLERWIGGQRKGMYIPHNAAYLRLQDAWMRTYEGEVLTAWCEQEPVGMTAYLWEQREEVAVEFTELILDPLLGEHSYRALCRRITEDIVRQAPETERLLARLDETWTLPENIQAEGYDREQVCMTMIRPLDVTWFLERLPKQDSWEPIMTFAIEDPLLTENTGCYEVTFHPKGKNRVQRSKNKTKNCLSLQSLVQYWSEKNPVYAPELV